MKIQPKKNGTDKSCECLVVIMLLISRTNQRQNKKENKMKKTNLTPKPVQAGDYGKTPQITTKTNNTVIKAQSSDTDGRKTLALWSH